MEGWKRTQIAGAGAGTAISDADAKRFAGLTPEERATIVQMAKLSSRVEIACTRARQSLNQVEAQRQEAVRIARSTFGPVYAVSDDGTKTLVTDQIQLSPIEQSQWRARADASLAIHLPAITEALDVLAEEVAVLRMMSPTLGGPAHVVLLAAQGAGDVVTSEAALEASLAVLQGAIQELWATASPD